MRRIPSSLLPWLVFLFTLPISLAIDLVHLLLKPRTPSSHQKRPRRPGRNS